MRISSVLTVRENREQSLATWPRFGYNCLRSWPPSTEFPGTIEEPSLSPVAGALPRFSRYERLSSLLRLLTGDYDIDNLKKLISVYWFRGCVDLPNFWLRPQIRRMS
jgi:hypothetical protein